MAGLIYEPKGRAREYAALACNIYRGCDHGCSYCYAPAATRRDREAFGQPAERPSFLADLRKEVAGRVPSEPILLCFTTDPYCHLDVEKKYTRETIKILHGGGHAVNVLTKGGTRALRDLDLFAPCDAFATTLTFLDPAQSQVWEPGAATPAERIAAIMDFHAAGIPTWVSLEPVLDPAVALEIIEATHKYVDLYKVGRWNYDARAKGIDWGKFAQDAADLLTGLGKPFLLKNDLKAALPPLVTLS